MNKIKLEVGKKYRNRKGDIHAVSVSITSTKFSTPGEYQAFNEIGQHKSDRTLDLIEEVIEPAQEPVKKPHKHAELIKAWADGAEIEILYEQESVWTITRRPSWYEINTYRIKPQEVPQWRKYMAQALKDGKVVEFYFGRGWEVACISKEYLLDPNQSLYEGNFRIRPEPKPDVVEFYHVDRMANKVSKVNQFYAHFKLIWDGTTGEIKDAVVIK